MKPCSGVPGFSQVVLVGSETKDYTYEEWGTHRWVNLMTQQRGGQWKWQSHVPPMHHLTKNDHWNGEIEMRNPWKDLPLRVIKKNLIWNNHYYFITVVLFFPPTFFFSVSIYAKCCKFASGLTSYIFFLSVWFLSNVYAICKGTGKMVKKRSLFKAKWI